MTGPKVGDRIRTTYTYEGVVDKVNTDGGVSFSDDDGYSYWSPSEDHCTLTILERAEPAWQRGDVALIAEYHNTPLLHDGRNFHWPDGTVYSFDQWKGDTLVHVLRNGEAVNP